MSGISAYRARLPVAVGPDEHRFAPLVADGQRYTSLAVRWTLGDGGVAPCRGVASSDRTPRFRHAALSVSQREREGRRALSRPRSTQGGIPW